MPDDLLTLQQYDQALRQWTSMVRQIAAARASQHHHGKHSPRTYKKGAKAGRTELSLAKNITNRIRRSAGEIDSIGWRFPRHGVFLEYGVSRGHSRRSGRLRSQDQWLTETVNSQRAKLEEIVGTYHADRVIHALGIVNSE